MSALTIGDQAPRALRRIGHKGADHIAPGNTLASFDAALAAGVDMIEFDVLPERPDGTGRLILAHDYHDAFERTPLTLEEGLDHFRSDAYAGVELDVDLKLPGYESRVIDALRERELDGRALISTMEDASLREVRTLAPEIRLGWSIPRARRDYLASWHTKAIALAVVRYLRRVLPARAARRLRAGEIDAVMSHWAVVTPRLVEAVGAAGGELYVWTVDDPAKIVALERLGVTGVISNDPRLFGPTPPPAVDA
jgi:glycerophosphoryl diester phosphodiesterase